jgi:hypothetical protein
VHTTSRVPTRDLESRPSANHANGSHISYRRVQARVQVKDFLKLRAASGRFRESTPTFSSRCLNRRHQAARLRAQHRVDMAG